MSIKILSDILKTTLNLETDVEFSVSRQKIQKNIKVFDRVRTHGKGSATALPPPPPLNSPMEMQPGSC